MDVYWLLAVEEFAPLRSFANGVAPSFIFMRKPFILLSEFPRPMWPGPFIFSPMPNRKDAAVLSKARACGPQRLHGGLHCRLVSFHRGLHRRAVRLMSGPQGGVAGGLIAESQCRGNRGVLRL